MCSCKSLELVTKSGFCKKEILRFAMLFLVLSSFQASGQSSQVDNLKKTLKSLQDTARIDCLNSLSRAFVLDERKDSALKYAELAYRESIKQNYTHGVAVSFLRKARITKHFDDDFLLAEDFARQSEQWFEKSANKNELTDLYYDLIYTLHSQSRFDEAIKVSEKRFALCKKNGDEQGMFDGLLSLSAICKDAGDYEKSFLYIERARQLGLQKANLYWIQCALFLTGELNMKIEDYASALKNYRQAFQMDNPELEKYRQNADFDIWMKMEYAEIFSNLAQFDSAWHYFELFKPAHEEDRYFRIYLVSTGEYYFLRRNYQKALDNFGRGLYFHKKLHDRNEIQRTIILIAKTHLALNNDSAALQYALEGLQLARETKAKQVFRDCYQVLYSVYDKWHLPDSANLYFRRYSAMKDAVANDQFKAKMAVADYEKKIELLDKEKLLHRQQLRQTAQQRTFLITGIAAILILGLILFRNVLLKRKNEANRREIAENELQLQKLEHQKTRVELQQHASELEMRALRAQMNPHFIFNCLNSINRFILENNKPQASAYLTKFSRLIRLILQNSQSAMISIESELESLQLYLELESLRFNHGFEFVIDVDDDVDVSAIEVPPLIIQPYAENAIWHGLMPKEEHGKLRIEIYEERNILCCKITDDGIGRKKAAELKSRSSESHHSMGMRITAERIAIMHHENHQDSFITITDLTLPDGRAGGTEVLLKIPIQP